MEKVKVGVVGCGMISSIYLKNCTQVFNHILKVIACADLMPELARKRAEEFSVPTYCTVEELLANQDIDVVLNLTAPAAHAEINMRALHAGKHIYTEKPFALRREEAQEVLALAESKGLLVGCAPDTFMGASLQTCRKLIDDGWIGTPYGANATIIMGSAGDGMHPNFQNFLKLGGDPMMDMGPYYLTALINLLGPVRRVTGSANQLHAKIKVQNPKSSRYGDTIPVEAPTNVAAVLDFHSGAVASLQAAKESFGYKPRLEIFGTEGNMTVPDPNFFGPVPGLDTTVIIQFRSGQSKEIPLTHGFTEDSRGIGLADIAYAIRSGRANRASGRLAEHVLDISLAIFEASTEERHIHLQTHVERPAPLPLGLKFNQLDS
ncbi:Gfo/Idh/MocA family protein [Paenibacillus alginolyticus]|uniref:Gfo/Idh/MocA family oxidoreductase n=1 Tax=Paenibacillus alginolyticus TaxID=59839 RepID=A0ABT4GKY9_9BACL|nr:Gfo/Idh/MocA family oxidoreductase [Paenibacillus alginolyticus]MCY9696874.1 Gfo/Idh/MocA family oxidoreductase [Paenibacillus alginolyticus]MEC0142036.1 Gfo/Idh/MocA family oxidoreductase [Paenibacillus alginolyticus]